MKPGFRRKEGKLCTPGWVNRNDKWRFLPFEIVKGLGAVMTEGERQKEAKTHKKHHSLQVSITACGNILDPDTGEFNSTAWSSQPIVTDASGLHSQSLHTTLEDILRKCKSQIASENYLLPYTNLSQFWSLLHGQRGWYQGSVLGGGGQRCTPKKSTVVSFFQVIPHI